MLALYKVTFASEKTPAVSFCSENVLTADALSAASIATDEVTKQYKKERLFATGVELLGIVTLEADRSK